MSILLAVFDGLMVFRYREYILGVPVADGAAKQVAGGKMVHHHLACFAAKKDVEFSGIQVCPARTEG
ncbi:hypothetical protein D3C75_1321840 [compost metagenome]